MWINRIRRSVILFMILLGILTTSLTGCGGSSGGGASETTPNTWDDMKWDEGEWQ